jgi:hypothetical protein
MQYRQLWHANEAKWCSCAPCRLQPSFSPWPPQLLPVSPHQADLAMEPRQLQLLHARGAGAACQVPAHAAAASGLLAGSQTDNATPSCWLLMHACVTNLPAGASTAAIVIGCDCPCAHAEPACRVYDATQILQYESRQPDPEDLALLPGGRPPKATRLPGGTSTHEYGAPQSPHKHTTMELV